MGIIGNSKSNESWKFVTARFIWSILLVIGPLGVVVTGLPKRKFFISS